jgi:anti-sigma B factor antagonist
MEIRERFLGSVVCLDVQGRLVVTNDNERLKEKVICLLFENHKKIILNFEEVSQVDTSGLSALISVSLAVERGGGEIKLLNLPPRIYDLLVLTRLITLFEVVDSEADAVRAFSEEADVQ